MKLGLQEKITFSSDMTEDIRDEVRSTFMEAMRHNLLHPCKCQVVGGKFLSIPSLSASFHWNAQEVHKLRKSC